MARSINKVILLGYLGKDPETKYTSGGNLILKCTVATTKSWKDKRSGEWQEKTEWHNVVSFNASEALAEALHKGSRVYVEGEITTNSWEDKKTEEKKYRTEINAGVIIDCGGKDEKKTSKPREQREPQREITDDDIPF